MWSNGTERNLKLIEAFFPWEVSPDQNTLRTLPKRWRLEEISGLSQFISSTHKFSGGETLAQQWMSTRPTVISGGRRVEVMQVSI